MAADLATGTLGGGCAATGVGGFVHTDIAVGADMPVGVLVTGPLGGIHLVVAGGENIRHGIAGGQAVDGAGGGVGDGALLGAVGPGYVTLDGESLGQGTAALGARHGGGAGIIHAGFGVEMPVVGDVSTVIVGLCLLPGEHGGGTAALELIAQLVGQGGEFHLGDGGEYGLGVGDVVVVLDGTDPAIAGGFIVIAVGDGNVGLVPTVVHVGNDLTLCGVRAGGTDGAVVIAVVHGEEIAGGGHIQGAHNATGGGDTCDAAHVVAVLDIARRAGSGLANDTGGGTGGDELTEVGALADGDVGGVAVAAGLVHDADHRGLFTGAHQFAVVHAAGHIQRTGTNAVDVAIAGDIAVVDAILKGTHAGLAADAGHKSGVARVNVQIGRDIFIGAGLSNAAEPISPAAVCLDLAIHGQVVDAAAGGDQDAPAKARGDLGGLLHGNIHVVDLVVVAIEVAGPSVIAPGLVLTVGPIHGGADGDVGIVDGGHVDVGHEAEIEVLLRPAADLVGADGVIHQVGKLLEVGGGINLVVTVCGLGQVRLIGELQLDIAALEIAANGGPEIEVNELTGFGATFLFNQPGAVRLLGDTRTGLAVGIVAGSGDHIGILLAHPGEGGLVNLGRHGERLIDGDIQLRGYFAGRLGGDSLTASLDRDGGQLAAIHLHVNGHGALDGCTLGVGALGRDGGRAKAGDGDQAGICVHLEYVFIAGGPGDVLDNGEGVGGRRLHLLGGSLGVGAVQIEGLVALVRRGLYLEFCGHGARKGQLKAGLQVAAVGGEGGGAQTLGSDLTEVLAGGGIYIVLHCGHVLVANRPGDGGVSAFLRLELSADRGGIAAADGVKRQLKLCTCEFIVGGGPHQLEAGDLGQQLAILLAAGLALGALGGGGGAAGVFIQVIRAAADRALMPVIIRIRLPAIIGMRRLVHSDIAVGADMPVSIAVAGPLGRIHFMRTGGQNVRPGIVGCHTVDGAGGGIGDGTLLSTVSPSHFALDGKSLTQLTAALGAFDRGGAGVIRTGLGIQVPVVGYNGTVSMALCLLPGEHGGRAAILELFTQLLGQGGEVVLGNGGKLGCLVYDAAAIGDCADGIIAGVLVIEALFNGVGRHTAAEAYLSDQFAESRAAVIAGNAAVVIAAGHFQRIAIRGKIHPADNTAGVDGTLDLAPVVAINYTTISAGFKIRNDTGRLGTDNVAIVGALADPDHIANRAAILHNTGNLRVGIRALQAAKVLAVFHHRALQRNAAHIAVFGLTIGNNIAVVHAVFEGSSLIASANAGDTAGLTGVDLQLGDHIFIFAALAHTAKGASPVAGRFDLALNREVVAASGGGKDDPAVIK